MSHDCVSEVNALLAEKNTRLASVIVFGKSTREPILLATEKADAKVRSKPVLVFASYCPMCGVSLVTGTDV